MQKVTYIVFLFIALGVVFTGCQKLEELEPRIPSTDEVEAVNRRGNEDNVFDIQLPGSVRSDDIIPIDEGDGPDSVNDDDDNEDGDEVQGAAKRG